jgi:farnesyl diphosphate synthase/geranylgeranyl diphosphate synthase type II
VKLSLEQFNREARNRCNNALQRIIQSNTSEPSASHSRLVDACKHSLLNGGKRIRPVLVYGAAQAVDRPTEPETLDHVACSVELVHTYSLIHDDLPAMDDDDFRRGSPSCHKAFDEATAILAGDALHSLAFELLSKTPGLDCSQRLSLISRLANAAGIQGMAAGQAIDIAQGPSDLFQLQMMHKLKTGAIIRAALAMGGIAAGASANMVAILEEYGDHIGLAFQVVDDILDVEGNAEQLGKTPGKDSAAQKATYVSILGVDGARREARMLMESAVEALSSLDSSADLLRDLARYIIERRH